MAWTKDQLIRKAYLKIGFGYSYDLTPEMIQDGLTTMDAMIATWAGEGIRIGYAMGADPQSSSANDSSGLIDAANEAVFMNLAKRLSGSFGKAMPQTDMAVADLAYKALLNKAISSQTIPMQMPNTLPVGAGNKSWRTGNRPFVNPPVDNTQVGPDALLELE